MTLDLDLKIMSFNTSLDIPIKLNLALKGYQSILELDLVWVY